MSKALIARLACDDLVNHAWTESSWFESTDLGRGRAAPVYAAVQDDLKNAGGKLPDVSVPPWPV